MESFENHELWMADFFNKNKDEYIFNGKIYRDRGKSGTSTSKRPDFMQMIEDGKQDKFDIIVVRDVSRFGRNIVESLVYIRELAKYKVEVYFVNDAIHSLNKDDDIKLGLLAMLAENESRKISDRTKAGIAIAREKPDSVWGSGNVMGYKPRGGHGKDFEIDEEQAETVVMIKDLYLYDDKSLTEIKYELEMLGRRTSTGKKKWSESVISRILSNPLYAGKQELLQSESSDFLEQKRIRLPKAQHIFKDVPTVPTLYSFEEYQAIQKKKEERSLHLNGATYGKRQINVFSEKLICKCGSSYFIQTWRRLKDGKDVRGFYCNNKKSNKSKASREKLGLDTTGSCDTCAIPEWHLQYMAKFIFSRLWKNKGQDIEEAFSIIKECFKFEKPQGDVAEIENINRNISKYMVKIETLTDMRADGDISKEGFRQRVDECKANIEVLKERKRKLELESGVTFDVDAHLKNIRKSLEEMIDFSKECLDEDVIRRFVDIIYHEADYEYSWFLKLDLSGDIEEVDVPEAYQIKITKKNNFVPKIIIKDSRRIVMDTVLLFEEARAYRKAYGNYLRQNQWNDLHVKVYT